MPKSPSPLRLLLLFQGMWEEECVDALRGSHDVVLEREGFDTMHWRGLARMATFDARRWVDRMCARYRGRIDAVWSNDDQFGCLAAAMIARRLGLPGADPHAIFLAQDKWRLRTALQVMPEHSVRCAPVSMDSRWRRGNEAWIDAHVAQHGLAWPLFCKPAKGSFSVLAARVGSAAELLAHLRLPWWDRVLRRAFNKPFAQLAATFPGPSLPHGMLLEEVMRGRQINVDGYAVRGDVHVLGVIDECMYPGEQKGARHFAGFTYPSRLPPELQRRVVDVATAAVRAVGYDHGLFNVELFVTDDGAVKVIEINPRGAGQFASLYRAAAGIDVQQLAIRLAAGWSVDPPPRVEPTGRVAASFVFRRFDGRPGVEPDAAARAWLAATHPDARLWCEPCSPAALRREYRWLGSHRHAVLNHAAKDFATLFAQGEECAQRLFGVAMPAGVREGAG